MMVAPKRRMDSKLQIASIFSGCGGFDFGFQQEGFKSIAAFDNDEDAAETFRHNVDASMEVCDLLAEQPLGRLRGIDVLLAGPPCQGFSLIGKRVLHDPRNELLVLSGRIAAAVRPRVFVLENVPGITAGRHKRYWKELLAIMSSAGYKTAELCVNGTETGIPQTRRRIILIAWLGAGHLSLELPVVLGGVLRDGIGTVAPDAPNHNPVPIPEGSKMAIIASRIRPGQKLSNVRNGVRSVHTWDIPEVFGRTSSLEKRLLAAILSLRRQHRVRRHGDADPVSGGALAAELRQPVAPALKGLVRKGFVRRKSALYDLSNSFNGTFRRLEWEKPSHTVDTRFGNPRYFLHPSENRGFTVREAARIQGFPDSFIFFGCEVSQYRQVGNAVPPPVARALAATVRRAILKA